MSNSTLPIIPTNPSPHSPTFFPPSTQHSMNPLPPSLKFPTPLLIPQNRTNLPGTTGRHLVFEPLNFNNTSAQRLDFTPFPDRADFLNHTPNQVKVDSSKLRGFEVSDFTMESPQQDKSPDNGFAVLHQTLQNIEIPQKGSRGHMKTMLPEGYLRPKGKTPALIKRVSEKIMQGKHGASTAMKYQKSNEDTIPDPLTHFTRSNSDVPPTLESNLVLVGVKEGCLGDNKYLNNLKDKKDSIRTLQQGDWTKPQTGMNLEPLQAETQKSSLNPKSKFAKNLFADFNNDSLGGSGGREGGLFQIMEKPGEYDFGAAKSGNQGDFEIENPDPISKLLDFESENSEDLSGLEQNYRIPSFDTEDRFFSPKKMEHFLTPTKGADMGHSGGKLNIFSTLTGKRQSKTSLFSDPMNSTNITDTVDPNSLRKGELNTSSKKEPVGKIKPFVCSRFETDFDILETIGSGEFGTVYKCQNKLDGLIYAIKCTQYNRLQGDKSNGQALNEAQALASLSVLDENLFIVRYYNAWIEDEKFYLVMEHCQNNLRKLKNDVKFSESMIRQIMRDICMGLKHLHSKKIVHLNIKPENILYSKTKKYKIGDLGLSKIALLCNNGEIIDGDSRYLAPELINENTQLYDLTKADIFSFGATIYELMTGAEMARNGQEWIDVRRGNLHKLEHLSYSNSLKSIIMSMMSINPDARPSASELLSNFLQSEIELELKWEKKQNRGLKKQIKELEDQLGLKRKKSM